MNRRIDAPERVVLLLSLVPYLLAHGEVTVKKLAEVFDIEPAQLLPLIEFLGTAGIPGETSAYQHEDLFDIDWEALEERGAVRLIRAVAVDDTPRFSSTERAALIAGLHSVIDLLPAPQRAHATSAIEKLGGARGEGAYTPSLSTTAEGSDDRAIRLAEAITSGCRVAFQYRDLRGNASERAAEPFSLTQSGGSWYLTAFCLDRMDERTFLVDSMRELNVLRDQPVERKATRMQRSAIRPEETSITAVISLREHALHRVSMFSPRLLAEPASRVEGWVRAEVELAFPSSAIRLVQSAPGDVIIESPAPAREAVHRWADRALAQYSE